MQMEKSLIKLIETEIIAEDTDFYDELIQFRGDPTTKAERQAWLDWAADMIVTRFNADPDEAANRIVVIEEYYKQIDYI